MKEKFVKVAEKAGDEIMKYLICVNWHRLSTWIFVRPNKK